MVGNPGVPAVEQKFEPVFGLECGGFADVFRRGVRGLERDFAGENLVAVLNVGESAVRPEQLPKLGDPSQFLLF